MSNWTHVAGIIRIDDLRLDEEKSKKDFIKIFGNELHFNSSSKEWHRAKEHPEEYLPLGSEGSLEMSVWVNEDNSCMAAYTVSVFGDLRDHDNPQSIVDWFKKKCEQLWIRDATITVRNEINGVVNWTYGIEAEGETE